jgi:hypothetical protein
VRAIWHVTCRITWFSKTGGKAKVYAQPSKREMLKDSPHRDLSMFGATDSSSHRAVGAALNLRRGLMVPLTKRAGRYFDRDRARHQDSNGSLINITSRRAVNDPFVRSWMAHAFVADLSDVDRIAEQRVQRTACEEMSA